VIFFGCEISPKCRKENMERDFSISIFFFFLEIFSPHLKENNVFENFKENKIF
jgi:hypothetical protein